MSGFFNVYNKNHQAREYHGLRNQGSTCYLNSVLQVLFMTKDFREAVGRCPNGDKDLIDHQLDRLFDSLEERIGETNEVTRKLGIDQVNEQRDAAEYLEKIFTMTSEEAAKIFEVQLIDRTHCWACGENTNEEKSFWNLPLPLKPSSDEHYENYDVMKAIKDFFKDSDFTDDNQLYCEKCQDKQDATTKCVVKHHPEVLMLLLKRFEFNYYQMSLVKNTRVVDVPCTIEIENQAYELYAYVEHFGSLRSGHYTATIKSQDEDRWYNFNDSVVRALNNPVFQEKKTERSKSAYLLFYRKKGDGEQSNRGGSHREDYRLDNNKKSHFPNSCKSKKGEDDEKRNIMVEKNGPNPRLIEEASDPREIKNYTRLSNQYNGNENGAKGPLGDNKRVGNQSGDDENQTSIDDDSCPKRRKTYEKFDRVGEEPTGRESDKRRKNNNTVQESERSSNPQHTSKQDRHEKSENLANQEKYKKEGKSRPAIQTNHEQKSNVKADVYGYREEQVIKQSQIKEEAGSKPKPEISSDNHQEMFRAKAKKQEKKQDGQKRRSYEHCVSISNPSSINDLVETKESVDTKKKKDKSNWSKLHKRFTLKSRKSKKGQPNLEETSEPHSESVSKKELDAITHDFQKPKSKKKKGKEYPHEDDTQYTRNNAEEEKTKSSLFCCGSFRKSKSAGLK